MKNKSLVCSFLILLLYGCSVSKDTRSAKRIITGRWILETITIEGNNEVLNDTLLNADTNKCFIGSSWNFSSNGSGTYSLLKTDYCKAITSHINWKINKQSDVPVALLIQEKTADTQSTSNNATVTMPINSITDSSLNLTYPIIHEQHTVKLLYSFSKKRDL